MLTVEINDTQLEQLIEKKALENGMTTQAFVQNVLSLKVHEQDSISQTLPFVIPSLNYKEHISTINYGINDENISKETVSLFSSVNDAAEYGHNLRKRER
eukprot:GDKK01050343.1.p1 GENE.GDKK01050343.1~~GDKK01050343.1.p1  ORF type:complete len:100 (-),score=18.00 GDKK01050343.1:86-385(-)